MKVYCLVHVDDEYAYRDLLSIWCTLEGALRERDRILLDVPVQYRESRKAENDVFGEGFAIDEMEVQ